MKPLLAQVVVCAMLAALAAPSPAATTMVLNGSPAHLCYQAAVRRDDDHGLDDCDAAIENQALPPMDLASTYSNRALLLARGGNLRAALKDHQQAVRLAPQVASIRINRANLYTRQRRFELALDDLDLAAGMDDPVRHLAFYNRALLHQRLGNAAAAREDAEQAVAYAPDNEAYAAYLKTLTPAEPVIVRPPRSIKVPSPPATPEP
ncbi:MAG: tetratricopeptide repeat protein [Pseudomonadales bacterium]